MADTRQQAEFFAKLGRIDEAMDVLEGGIRGNPRNSPLLYLDLLALLHEAERQSEYRQFREQFVRLFNASIPEFKHFREEGQTLDAYPSLLEHINSLWESPQVLDVMEACILRGSDTPVSTPFDLAAFRELLTMHGVAGKQHNVRI
jgi:hypothetical protein